MNTFLQIFFFVDAFIIGVLAATAVRHAYAHFRPEKHEPEKPHHPSGDHLPTEMRKRLLEESEHHYQTILDKSAARLQHDLETSAEHINKQLDRLATEIVGNELEHYRIELDRLRKQTQTDIGNIKTEVGKHQDEFKARMQEDVAAEKQHLIQKIDTKLADAVMSFLTETLQHNVDLGAQSAYLTSMLEEHKADIIRGVGDETEAAK